MQYTLNRKRRQTASDKVDPKNNGLNIVWDYSYLFVFFYLVLDKCTDSTFTYRNIKANL